MKYKRKKLTTEVNDWRTNQSEYYRILAFVHDIFTDIGQPIIVDIPVPTVKVIQFHWNTSRYRFDVEDKSIIYLSDKDVGKELHVALITALVKYYAMALYQTDESSVSTICQEALDGLEVELTLSEIAFTSSLVVTGIVVGKKLLSKIF